MMCVLPHLLSLAHEDSTSLLRNINTNMVCLDDDAIRIDGGSLDISGRKMQPLPEDLYPWRVSALVGGLDSPYTYLLLKAFSVVRDEWLDPDGKNVVECLAVNSVGSEIMTLGANDVFQTATGTPKRCRLLPGVVNQLPIDARSHRYCGGKAQSEYSRHQCHT
jgi:hypothetical protein